jgi:KaiC/GvpD/RAD55 family RecA-like ATPase
MDRASTGIGGLDELLGGGIPKGRCVLVVGSPGSGKTTLAMQFLRHGAVNEESGLYVTMDESPDQIKEDLSSFRWDLDKLEREGKLFFIDATPVRRIRTRTVGYGEHGMLSEAATVFPELTLKDLIRTINKVVEEEKIQRIVVDPVTSLVLRYEKPSTRRRAMLMLFDALEATECSSLIITELRTAMLDRAFQLEEFLSQGVILLHTILREDSIIRAIQIEKMRGIPHDVQLRPYQITAEGIQVFSKDRVFQ